MTLVRSAAAAALVLAIAAPAQAPIQSFEDRALWQAAIGGATGGENFDGFLVDTPFDEGPLALSDGMTIGSDATAGENNSIDVPPISAEIDGNGTPTARVFNGSGSTGPLSPFILFDGGVTAVGASFFNFNDEEPRTGIELFSGATSPGTLMPPATSVTPETIFFGFWGDAGEVVDRIVFTRVENDVFGMDDIEIRSAGGSAEIPLPFAAPPLVFGLGALTVVGRRRRG